MAEKRYYWLKLKEDFFDEKYVKALRKLPQGDSLAIVYLKMQLKSLKTDGVIKYDRIMPSPNEELALLLDEDVNVVELAVEALIRFGVVERLDNDTLYMTALQDCIGSETQTAERVRKHRALQQKEAQKNELEKASFEGKALHCNSVVTNCNSAVTNCNTEIDIEKDREKNNIILIPPKSPLTEQEKKKNNPTKVEVITYFTETLHRSEAEAVSFWTWNENRDWRVGSTPIRKWELFAEAWRGSETTATSALERTYSKDELEAWKKDLQNFDDIEI